MVSMKVIKPLDLLIDNLVGEIRSAAPRQVVTAIEDFQYEYRGVYRGRFTVENEDEVDGVIKKIQFLDGNKKAIVINGVNADASDVLGAEDTWSAFGTILAGNDRINGSNGNDALAGFFGNDAINGLAGSDFLYGDVGNDTLKGGPGNDYLLGEDGRDLLFGSQGEDWFVMDSRDDFDIVKDFRPGDSVVIDTSRGSAFFRATYDDVRVSGNAKVSNVFVDGDLVAKVYGAEVSLDDIILL